jgi:hypothetical protein
MAVCPEPVLVKRSFLYINGMAKYIYIYMRFPHHRRHGAVQPHDPQRSDLVRVQTTQPHNNTKPTSVQIIQTFAPSLSWQMNRRRYFGSKGNVQRSALRFGDISRVNDGFETRRGSNFRPFSFGSSRFNVQMSAQKAATTQFESQRRDIHIPRSR